MEVRMSSKCLKTWREATHKATIAATTKLSPQHVSDLVLGVRGKRPSYEAVSAIQNVQGEKMNVGELSCSDGNSVITAMVLIMLLPWFSDDDGMD